MAEKLEEHSLQSSTMSENDAQPPENCVQSHGDRQHETPETRTKALDILDACTRRDIDQLKRLAVSKGGFLSDVIRRQACKSNYPSYCWLHE